MEAPQLTQSAPTPEQMLSTAQAAGIIGCGRTKLYELMKAKKLRAVKDGGRTKIPTSAVAAYQASLPDWSAQAA